ncbi:MAG: AsmA family protein [Methylococcales bacterium]|nr:AsmA family protein [Methylococcales bacterium]
MRNPLKIILSIVAGLVLLLIIAVSAAVFFINPNSFKPAMIAVVKDKIGRDLVIDGDVKLAFFPALGLTTGKMTLSNTAGFANQPLASLEASHINVELMPLLAKKIEVSGIVLTGLTLNLSKNQQGVHNWDDLIARHTPPAVTSNNAAPPPVAQALPTAALSTFAIGAVKLDHAQINWQNQQTGKKLVFKDLNLTTDKVTSNQPVTVDLAFVVDNMEAKTTQTIKLNTLLTVNDQLDTLALSHSNLQLVTTGDSIPNKSLTSVLTIADSSLSLPQQTLKVTGLQLKSGDLTLDADGSAEHLQDNPVFQGKFSVAEFNLAKVMKDFALTAPVMREPTALNKLALSVNVSATKDSLDLQNLSIKLDGSTISGSSSLKNFAAPNIAFNLAVDKLNVDNYLPPADKSKKPITSPTIALTAGAAAMPVELLRKLNANGDLAIATLNINDLNVQDVHFHLSAKDGVVNTAQTIKQFYQGEYAGKLTMDVRNAQKVLAIDEKLSRVQVEPLLIDFKNKAVLRGTLDASAQLNGRGNTTAELKSSLNGAFRFICKDGAIIGFSLQKMLDKAKAMLKGADVAVDGGNEQTPFVEISGTSAINNGLISNQDFVARTAKVRVTGIGTAHLVTEQLDYKLTANLFKDKATATEAEQFHETPMIIAVGGTFSQPTYTLDVAALITDKTKAKVEQVLENLQTDENKAKIQQALDNLKPEDQGKVKKLAPKLGKLFKKLF